MDIICKKSRQKSKENVEKLEKNQGKVILQRKILPPKFMKTKYVR